ncbi:MAG TPA: glycerate-2-kinase family protein, partial [Herpetosiphonaceae bacterium]
MPLPTASQLIPPALAGDPGGALLAEIAAAALRAADPAAALRRFVARDGPALIFKGQAQRLPAGGRWLAVGAGKAGAAMAGALLEIAGELIAEGIVVVKDGHGALGRRLGPIDLPEAGHPFPDERGAAAAGRIARLLAGATERDGIIALLSGGGSALLTLPAPGLALDDLRRATELLMHAGAPIEELNTLRRHCERLKGGGMARLAWPARCEGLILSDVVGSPLHVIASGPLSADPTSPADALAIIERRGLAQRMPAPVMAHLRRAAGREADQPGAAPWERVTLSIIGDNGDAQAAARMAA